VLYPENEKALDDQDIWTVQRILKWSGDWLKSKISYPLVNPRLDVEVLLGFVLGVDRMGLYLQMDRPLTKSEREQFKKFLLLRADSTPVAYIIGYRDFYRHRFKVTNDTLIPRPDTEVLVEAVAAHLRQNESAQILDIGTGCGCIALSLAAEFPRTQVEAWDISLAALAVAKENQEKIGLTNVKFVSQNALDLEAFKTPRFDVIVSNPPYVPWGEKVLCSPETLNFEPQTALFAAEEDGLTFYRILAKSAQSLLYEGGKIFLEFGASQAEKVAHLIESHGWRKIIMMKDLSGLNRAIAAERP